MYPEKLVISPDGQVPSEVTPRNNFWIYQVLRGVMLIVGILFIVESFYSGFGKDLYVGLLTTVVFGIQFLEDLKRSNERIIPRESITRVEYKDRFSRYGKYVLIVFFKDENGKEKFRKLHIPGRFSKSSVMQFNGIGSLLQS